MISLLKSAIIQFNIVLWIISIALFRKTNQKRYLLIVFVLFIVNEVIHYFAGFDMFHSHRRTQMFYDSGEVGSMFSSDFQKMSTNFTEGYYKSKKCAETADEDELNRFEHFVDILHIQSGDRLLDLGCGYGNFVGFLRKRGFDAYGMTISNSQYDDCVKTHGNYFYLGDYTKYNSELKNRFDFIIFPGSLEHTFGGHAGKMSTYIYKYNAMIDMFSMMKKYFRKESTKKRILTTTIHNNPKFMNSKEYYILERMYGGCQPLITKYSVADSLKASGYNVTLKKDYTWQYYYTSYCDNTHFGNPININKAYILPCVILYPPSIFFYIYFTYGYWMWMWDGKHHFQRDHDTCIPEKGCDLSFEKDINKRPATLLYTIAQLE